MKESCENQYCENPGFKEVAVSVRKPGDQKRTLCAACEEVYTWGVQHGTMTVEQARLFIVVVTDRGIVAYARAFRSQVEAENALVKYLREHHRYSGSRCLESVYDWVGEQAYLTAEVVDQDALTQM